MMSKILCYSIPVHYSVKYIDFREEEMLIKEFFKELEKEFEKFLEEFVEEQICRLTDVLTFPQHTTKCENVIFHISKPEVVPKAFRFNIKAAINDFLKYPVIALEDCKDLHIFERLKKMICILAIAF